jgi:hypothetical protein
MIECDNCKAQVNPKVKEEHIPETKLDIKYIQCEECKKKYIVLLEDVKTKTMILRIKNMQNRYKRMYGRKNIVKVEAYRKSMEKYQKIIQRYQLQLRNNNRELIKDYL